MAELFRLGGTRGGRRSCSVQPSERTFTADQEGRIGSSNGLFAFPPGRVRAWGSAPRCPGAAVLAADAVLATRRLLALRGARSPRASAVSRTYSHRVDRHRDRAAHEQHDRPRLPRAAVTAGCSTRRAGTRRAMRRSRSSSRPGGRRGPAPGPRAARGDRRCRDDPRRTPCRRAARTWPRRPADLRTPPLYPHGRVGIYDHFAEPGGEIGDAIGLTRLSERACGSNPTGHDSARAHSRGPGSARSACSSSRSALRWANRITQIATLTPITPTRCSPGCSAARTRPEPVRAEPEDERPDDPAARVEEQKPLPVHVQRAGEERRVRPQDRREAAEEDDLAAVAQEQVSAELDAALVRSARSGRSGAAAAGRPAGRSGSRCCRR